MTEARIRNLVNCLKGRVPLGFGISGAIATRLFSSQETDRLIGTARDQGISIFDAAPSYGAGLGERRIGRAVGNDPSAFVMTKAGLSKKRGLGPTSRFAPQDICQSVEGSLRRLKRDRIDLLWLHGPGREHITDALKDALLALMQAGKIAAVGITSRYPPASALAGTAPFSAIMAPVHQAISPLASLPSNAVFFGIECLQTVPSDSGVPRHRSQAWRMARSILRRHPPIHGSTTVDGAFKFAFETAQSDVVMMTTTKSSRIEQNRFICDRILDQRRDAKNAARFPPVPDPSDAHAAHLQF